MESEHGDLGSVAHHHPGDDWGDPALRLFISTLRGGGNYLLPTMPTRYRAYLPRYPTKPHLQLQVEKAVGALRCPGGGTLDVETVSSNGG